MTGVCQGDATPLVVCSQNDVSLVARVRIRVSPPRDFCTGISTERLLAGLRRAECLQSRWLAWDSRLYPAQLARQVQAE